MILKLKMSTHDLEDIFDWLDDANSEGFRMRAAVAVMLLFLPACWFL